jgi:signal transduction histidine kinase
MPGGGVITISTSLSGEFVRIDFKDIGSGMSAEVKEKIFEPFFTTKKTGTGLGLSICNGIVNTYNGFLEFKSQVNKGTTVSVMLPCHKEVGRDKSTDH